jgi:2'-5' RNA ligase
MRLFIGIAIPKPLKDTLSSYQNALDTGRVVAKSNYHLTLVYLGETSHAKKASVHQALKTLVPTLSPCTLPLSSIQTFKKGTTHIVYVDVIKTDALETIQNAVHASMTSLNFSLDPRPYTPHITLARKVKNKPPNIPVNEMVTVNAITLFLSHRIKGELTYTPLETYPLK